MPEEPKIWYLLDALAKGALYYKSKGLTHGDIQPRTVHLTPASEVILIDNMLLHPSGRDLLSKALQNPAYRGPLSPQQLAAFSNKQSEARHDAFASEVWAIGMTALAYAVRTDVCAFYDWEKKQFKDKILNVEMDRLTKMGYSESLIAVFKCLLAEKEEMRPSVEELNSCLSKTEQKSKSELYPIAPIQYAVSTLQDFPNILESNNKTPTAITPKVNEPGSPVTKRGPVEFAKEQDRVALI